MKKEERSPAKRRRQSVVEYDGFGFRVVLVNVPMILVRGSWIPDVDFNKLSDLLLGAVARKPTRLTGQEVRFIRHSLDLNLKQFADRFGVTHPAVMKWERAGRKATAMSWAVEKDIRLHVLRTRLALGPAAFVEAYAAFEKEATGRGELVRLDVSQSA